VKKTLIAVAIVFGILFGFGYDLFKDWSLKKEIDSWPEYYRHLAENCRSKGCCISSVRNMVQGNYELSPETGCPDGFKGNQLMCIDSYKWCESIE
jgi:hypothetical protein